MLLEQMTTAEVEASLRDCSTVIIPSGVMEAHGPHLPLASDTIEAYRTAQEAAERVRVFVAPPLAYGMCRTAARHPGTIGIRGDTLRSLLEDVISSLAATGFESFIVYSGHASTMHLASLEEAAENALRTLPSATIAVVSHYHVIAELGAEVIETEGDHHAGEVETSVMLHLAPELVKTERIPEETYRTIPRDILVRNPRRYWEVSVDGNPKVASSEKGGILTKLAVEHLANLVTEIGRFRE